MVKNIMIQPYGSTLDEYNIYEELINNRKRSIKTVHPFRVIFIIFIGFIAGLIGIMHMFNTTSLLSLKNDSYSDSTIFLNSNENFIKYNNNNNSFPKSNDVLISECTEYYIIQELDHFTSFNGTYKERYFICDKYWSKNKKAPIFVYVGNEANVELYLNHSGLMWENAPAFNAMLVFAEHRYFGKSIPFPETKINKNPSQMQYLSSAQALADYAYLITFLKDKYNLQNHAIIGFGGSYGGMLASWLRMKYPHIIDGVIAGSAPILSFLNETPPVDTYSFARITTYDATPKAGSNKNCVRNVRNSWQILFKLIKTDKGRNKIIDIFHLCDSLKDEKDGKLFIDWVKTAFDYLAMGNYPYPSSYITNGNQLLPAFPFRVACSHLSNDYNITNENDSLLLLDKLRDAIGVYYNGSLNLQCYSMDESDDESKRDNDYWGYLYCTEMFQPFDQDGINDMFWPEKSNWTMIEENCMEKWNVKPRLNWPEIEYGGRKILEKTSNIVFSNGNYDPWSGYGVLNNYSDSVISLLIHEGAHHLDLMFSNKLDPPSVKKVRKEEIKYIKKWIKQVEKRNNK